jgi:Tfp pilus assembly protein PilV
MPVITVACTAINRREQVPTAYLLGNSLAVLVLFMIGVALAVCRVKSVQQRKALEQRRKRGVAGRALIRYVQLNRQCSEAIAYQRLGSFVKQHLSSDDASSIVWMAAHNRQRLLQLVQGLLVLDPNAIDKI